jgi:hypothetical protein
VSTFLSQARARALRPAGALPRPRLTVVQRMAPRAPRVPFVVLVLTLLVGGLVGLLLLNTTLQRGAYLTTSLRQTSSDLTIRQQRLELEVAALREPQRVASEAQRLGMVQNDSPAFLSLSTGRIIGTPIAGRRANQVDVSHVSSVAHSHSGKVQTLGAGEANSLSTGPIALADPDRHKGKAGDRQGQNLAAAGQR